MQESEIPVILKKMIDKMIAKIKIMNINIKIINMVIKNMNIYIDIYRGEVYDIKHKEENKCIK